MKKLLMLLMLAPALLYCNGKPKIQFDALTYNFGKQNPNIEVRHIFTFTNAGDAVLYIEKIVPG